MDLGLAGKVIAVTGSASGIGRAKALLAAEEGMRVALIDRDDSTAVCDETGDESHAFVCDLRDTTAADATFSAIEAEFSRLDLLVNCAGIMGDWPKPATEASNEDWSLVIDTNLRGTFACCRVALALLRRTNSAIVNVASELGLVNTAGLMIYGASKVSVINLTHGLAIEENAHGVRGQLRLPRPRRLTLPCDIVPRSRPDPARVLIDNPHATPQHA